MTRREAGLILGISPTANKTKLKEAHKRIMLLNHPDRGCISCFYISEKNSHDDSLLSGGSPYLAAKINEAKDYLETNKS